MQAASHSLGSETIPGPWRDGILVDDFGEVFFDGALQDDTQFVMGEACHELNT